MNEDVNRAERLVRDHVQPDVSNIVQRDKQMLSELCRRFKMVISPENMAHLATLLGVMGVDTKQEYPKAIYDAKGKLLGVTNDAKEEQAMAVRDASAVEPSIKEPPAADLTDQVTKVLDAPAPGESS